MKGKILLIGFLAVVSPSFGNELWRRFASNPNYNNFKLVSGDANNVLERYYSSVSASILWTKMSCATDCVRNSKCEAFNCYFNVTHHTCELLADNFCLNSTGSLSLQPQSSSSVFDKMKDGTTLSCLDQYLAKVPANKWCEKLRPGCAGTWPVCTDCVQSCIDCQRRYNHTGNYQCTIRPGGESTQPILANCYLSRTLLMKRNVDIQYGNFDDRYSMGFPDMNRIIQLKVYTQIQFLFVSSWNPYVGYVGVYGNPYIDPNGTLSNLTFLYSGSGGPDYFQLNGGTLAPAPFLVVDNGTGTCGSFWRLKTTNLPSCPGGNISLFGPIQRNSAGLIIYTGIRFPPAEAAGKLLQYSDITLLRSQD